MATLPPPYNSTTPPRRCVGQRPACWSLFLPLSQIPVLLVTTKSPGSHSLGTPCRVSQHQHSTLRRASSHCSLSPCWTLRPLSAQAGPQATQEGQTWLHSPAMPPPAGQAQPAGFWACPVPAVPRTAWGLTVSAAAAATPGSPAAVGPEAAGKGAALFWECDGAQSRQQLQLQPFGLHAVLLPSDEKAELRTAEGPFEGLNSSCGWAKVGCGQSVACEPALPAVAFVLTVTHTACSRFFSAVCPGTQSAVFPRPQAPSAGPPSEM